jgi:predicted nuclease with TOPRIM domain
MGKKHETPVAPDELTVQADLFSTDDYTKGDVKIRQEIGEQLNKYLLRGAGYLLTTILGGLIVVVWTLKGDISEVKGKVSTPDKYLETIDGRLNKLETENKELQSRNYQLEIEKLKLEIELKNNK